MKTNRNGSLVPTATSERRNYWAFLFEGGLFTCAIGFVNAQTLLPALILGEGGPSWVAALMPGIMVIGMFGVPVLTAGWIDRLPRMKPFAAFTGFCQRFIYVPVGFVLIFGDLSPLWTVVLLAATPFLSGLIGGVGFSAWQRLYMGSLPASRRASNLAYRLLFGGITGILAGIVIERTLLNYPGNGGYGLLHLFASVFFFASWGTLLLVRESPQTPSGTVAAPGGVRRVFKRYYAPGPDRRSRLCFAGALVLMHSFMMIPPFYAVTILERLGEPKSYLGVLAMWQMVGQSAGNLLAAAIGDRWGGRATFGFGLIMICVFIAPASFIENGWQAQAAYAAFGFSQMLMVVGKDTLLMELSPDDGKAGYLSGMALLTMVAILSFSGVTQVVWSLSGFHAVTFCTVVLCLGSFACLSWVDDPRGKRITPLRAIRRGILRSFR